MEISNALQSGGAVGGEMTRARGSILIYALLALFVVSAGAGIVYTYSSAIARAQKAEADAVTLRAANGELLADNHNLRASNERSNKLLAARQVERNTADNIERAVNAKLAEIYRSNPQARDWRDADVPDAVLRGLRAESDSAIGADGKAVPARGPAGAQSSTGLAAPRQ